MGYNWDGQIMSKIDLLRNSCLFSSLSDQELELLSDCMGRRRFGRGMIIFHKGSIGQNLYLIDSGKVRIFILSEEGQEITVNIYGVGECFGELSLLDGLPRSAGAITMEDTATYTLHRDDFHRFLLAYPRIAVNILQVVSRRLRYTTVLAESFAFMDAYSRVAAKLIELGERYGNRMDDEAVEIDFQLTQAELASWVAISRESVNKILGVFRDQEVIDIRKGVIVILNQGNLERLAIY